MAKWSICAVVASSRRTLISRAANQQHTGELSVEPMVVQRVDWRPSWVPVGWTLLQSQATVTRTALCLSPCTTQHLLRASHRHRSANDDWLSNSHAKCFSPLPTHWHRLRNHAGNQLVANCKVNFEQTSDCRSIYHSLLCLRYLLLYQICCKSVHRTLLDFLETRLQGRPSIDSGARSQDYGSPVRRVTGPKVWAS